MFYIGLDIGQANNYTAMTTLEKKVVSIIAKTPQVEYHCPHLERFELKKEYPEMMDDLKKRINATGLFGRYQIIADATGVGKPVVDYIRKEGLSVVPVIITSGSNVIYDQAIGGWHVPKRDLISSVQLALQQRVLKFSAEIPNLEDMIKELMNFKIKITTHGNDTYEAWREGETDDLVLSLALAVWYAKNYGITGNPPEEKSVNSISPWLIQKGI